MKISIMAEDGNIAVDVLVRNVATGSDGPKTTIEPGRPIQFDVPPGFNLVAIPHAGDPAVAVAPEAAIYHDQIGRDQRRDVEDEDDELEPIEERKPIDPLATGPAGSGATAVLDAADIAQIADDHNQQRAGEIRADDTISGGQGDETLQGGLVVTGTVGTENIGQVDPSLAGGNTQEGLTGGNGENTAGATVGENAQNGGQGVQAEPREATDEELRAVEAELAAANVERTQGGKIEVAKFNEALFARNLLPINAARRDALFHPA